MNDKEQGLANTQTEKDIKSKGRRHFLKQGSKTAGVIVSELVPDNVLQTNLFVEPADARRKKLMNVIDNMNAAYRNDVLKFGTTGTHKNWKMRSEKRSKRYTTRWDELCTVR